MNLRPRARARADQQYWEADSLALARGRRSFHAVAARLQARRHRALILIATRTSIARGHSPALLRRIETGLGLGPVVALVLIRRLLFRRLPILRVNIEIVGRRGRLARLIGTRRHIDYRVTVGTGLPLVVDVVGVIVRHAAEPDGGVERRQHVDEQAHRRPRDDESVRSWRIPDAAREVETAATVEIRPVATRQRAHHSAAARIVVTMVIAVIEHLPARSAATRGLLMRTAATFALLMRTAVVIFRVARARKAQRQHHQR